MQFTSRSGAAARPFWMVVLAAAMIVGVAMGVRQVMGLYLVPVTGSLNLGREAFGLAMAVANLVWGAGSPVAGAISDRYGTGRVIVGGTLITIAGLYLMYAATSKFELVVSGLLLGTGIAGTGVTTLVGAVGRMSAPEQRMSAMSAVSMGSGIGILVALPYTHVLIETLGWRDSLLAIIVTMAAFIPLATVLSGRPAAVVAVGAQQSMGEALREAMRHPSFWLLIAGFFVCGFHLTFVGVHLPAFVVDKGLPSWVGYWALMAVGVTNVIGTYLVGLSTGVVEKRISLSFIYLTRCIVFLGFLFLPMTEWTVIALSAVLGLLWLSTVPLTSGLVATFFGPAWMSMLFGIVFLSHQVGSFAGVWMAGALFDLTQSYDAMWWFSVALGVFAALVHWPIVERPVDRLRMATAP